MSISERKEREKSEMRELVLQTALKLFIDKGFENVSIRKIADAIDYSPGTIYLYYKDKDEILFELHNRGFSEFYKFQLAVQNIEDPIARLDAHGRAYIDFALSNPEYYDIMFIARAPAKKIKLFNNWELGDRTYSLLKDNVKSCIDAGYYQGQNLEAVVFALWAFVHGIASLIIRERMQLVPKDVLQQLTAGALQFMKSTAK